MPTPRSDEFTEAKRVVETTHDMVEFFVQELDRRSPVSEINAASMILTLRALSNWLEDDLESARGKDFNLSSYDVMMREMPPIIKHTVEEHLRSRVMSAFVNGRPDAE